MDLNQAVSQVINALSNNQLKLMIIINELFDFS